MTTSTTFTAASLRTKRAAEWFAGETFSFPSRTVAGLDVALAMHDYARDADARFVIDTDAHRTSELAFMRYGVDQARRGLDAVEALFRGVLASVVARGRRPSAQRRAR